MKKTKIIIPALGILLLSTAASVTGTVAWFAMNTSVTATGMQVQAKAEKGLLISADKTDASWANTDATAYNTAVSLLPTSTNNASAWYHSNSLSADSATSTGTYSTLGTSAGENVIVVKTTNLVSTPATAVANITYEDSNTDDAYDGVNENGYYLMTRFYLKSSADAIPVNGTSNWLSINNVSISGITNSLALDASLRIGVKIGESFKIIAPFAAASASYNVGGTAATTAYVGTLAANGNYNPDVNTGFAASIPAKVTDAPLNIDIYLWFEGEDANCKSNNVVNILDTLTIGVGFGLVTVQPAH